MNILLISSYPNNFDKSRSVFVYRLMQSLTKLGCEIVVISPKIWRDKNKEYIIHPGEQTYGYEEATVYHPKYFDFPNRIRIGKYSIGRLNIITYKRTVFKTLKNLDFKPDIVYAHFLYRSGPAAIMAGKYFKIPAVVALGESSLQKHENIFGKKNMQKLIHQFSGVISVSNKNKNYCVEELGLSSKKIKVFPNSVDHKVFFPRNKFEMREKYSLPQDKFIVAFTGHFIERKGPLRVLEAINNIDGNLGGIFIGSGEQEPHGEKVLFKGKVSNKQVAELLSASDVFVLPTKNEGSCNAIVEAMACGLPIISSDIEAIREQVDENSAILCNPNSVSEIKKAIEIFFKDKTKKKKMKNAVLKLSSNFSSKERALAIMNFLQSLKKNNS